MRPYERGGGGVGVGIGIGECAQEDVDEEGLVEGLFLDGDVGDPFVVLVFR